MKTGMSELGERLARWLENYRRVEESGPHDGSGLETPGGDARDQASPKRRVTPLALPLVGLAAIAWFVIRVVPKPVRATYPCQRVAAGIGGSFLAYVVSVFASLRIFRALRQRSSVLFALTAMAAVVLAVGAFALMASGLLPELAIHAAPTGTPQGIFPGRVAWTHDPNATSWDGVSGNFWDDGANDQAAIDAQVSTGIQSLTGTANDRDAWNALFRFINRRFNRGNIGYAAGDKVAIKINQNNAKSRTDTNIINGHPHLILATIKTLVNAGVPQGDITIFDASRYVTENIRGKVGSLYPAVRFLDYSDPDRYVTGVINYSPEVSLNANASDLARPLYEAKYAIDMAILKGHQGQGVTLCAKNFYGATGISVDYRQNSHGFGAGYVAFADWIGHDQIGRKVALWMIDMLYAHRNLNGVPSERWTAPPFNNDWPSSVLMSEDGVAIDAVALDFYIQQFGGIDRANAASYMKTAAGRGLGVYDEWSDPVTRHYTGPNTIDLVYLETQAGSGRTLAVTKMGAGACSVTSTPSGISCGSNCSVNFTQGSAVTLSASAAAGSVISAWGGACAATGTGAGTDSGSCSLTMGTDEGVTIQCDVVNGQVAYPAGVPVPVPGRIEAENYDLGGEGVAYHDTTPGNSGAVYRNDDVDIQVTTDTGGGYNVGWTAAGEWLEYTVNVANTASYRLDVRVAAIAAGANMHLEVDGANVSQAMAVPATGGWQSWTTITKTGVPLPAGQHVLRLFFDAGGVNVNWLNLSVPATPTVTATATPTPTATATPTAITSLSVNAGGGAASPFVADAYYTGGTVATNWTGAIDTSAVSNPAPQVVYQSERWGPSTYTLPGFAPGSSQIIRLHFCENYFKAVGSRKFNVTINGKLVLPGFDIFATTGTMHKATVQQFTVDANATGQYVIQLTTAPSNPLINGIEIVPAGPTPTPTLTVTPTATFTPTVTPTPTPTGVRTPIVLQASTLNATSSGQAISRVTDAAAPGGTWTKLGSNAAGQWMQFTTTNIPAGTYQFNMGYRSNPTRGIHNVTIDGTAIGGTIDQYATTPSYISAPSSTVSFASSQTHVIRMTVTGKNAAATLFEISAVQFIFRPQ